MGMSHKHGTMFQDLLFFWSYLAGPSTMSPTVIPRRDFQKKKYNSWMLLLWIRPCSPPLAQVNMPPQLVFVPIHPLVPLLDAQHVERLSIICTRLHGRLQTTSKVACDDTLPWVSQQSQEQANQIMKAKLSTLIVNMYMFFYV